MTELISETYAPDPPRVDRNANLPKLMVEYHCDFVFITKKKKKRIPCDGHGVLNAYLGPPKCCGTKKLPHKPTLMRVIGLA